ncbi:hypothetical protein DPX16_22712 [Anabarilius grahami]|uniref:Uncharacterized protein n=1 Tax=Anabarilius grahami TaxID=495550 RepID=A0A3N0XXB9_ANAGA|nr:hypothetical protein DPX16_22712 [Anabarilius grahami]
MMTGSVQVDLSVQYVAVLRLWPVWLDADAIWFRGIFGTVGSRIKTAAKEELKLLFADAGGSLVFCVTLLGRIPEGKPSQNLGQDFYVSIKTWEFSL